MCFKDWSGDLNSIASAWVTHVAFTTKMWCVVDRVRDDKYQLCSEAGADMHQKFAAATDPRVVAVRRFSKG